MSIRMPARNLVFAAALTVVFIVPICAAASAAPTDTGSLPSLVAPETIPLTLRQLGPSAAEPPLIPISLTDPPAACSTDSNPNADQTAPLPTEPSRKDAKEAAAAKKRLSSKAARADGPTTIRKASLSRALSFRGVRYRWGGSSRLRGFDCSGLTRYFYLREGINLPHSVKLQFRLGKPVSASDLQPGDLVFFNTSGPLSHVGIYLGDNKFLHAANTRRGVTVTSLSNTYYKQRYAGARRYKS